MKKKKILPLLFAGALAFTAAGVAVTINTNMPSGMMVAHAAETSFDLSNKSAGKWALDFWGSTPGVSYTLYKDTNFYEKPNSLTQPTPIPESIQLTADTAEDPSLVGQTLTVSSVGLFDGADNDPVYGSQWPYSIAATTTAQEYDPNGQQVPNDQLKIATDNNSAVSGISTVKPGDVVVVKIVPAANRPADLTKLTGAFYAFFNNDGKYTPNISYSYAFDSAAKSTDITDTTSPSSITAPSGAKTLQLSQNGYIDPTWTGGDANVTIDANGKITGLDNPAEAGKTLTFTLTSGVDSTITHTFNVTIPAKNNPDNGGGNGGNSGTVIVPSNNGNNASTTNSVPTVSSSSSTATATEPATQATSKRSSNSSITTKGAIVYAAKGIYMYKNANFKKSQRIAKYPKAKRVNRPMFVVTGYARSNNGTLRYKVRDVNHGKKTANKVGYITASRKYVVNVYYQTTPKNKKITVINKKGINAYKNANLTKKVKNYKKGTRLTVKKIVKHNLTSRYQLSNGDYVTANKKLIIQGNY